MPQYFAGLPTIAFEGPASDHPFAFKYYNKHQVVGGKTMGEHFKFAMAGGIPYAILAPTPSAPEP